MVKIAQNIFSIPTIVPTAIVTVSFYYGNRVSSGDTHSIISNDPNNILLVTPTPDIGVGNGVLGLRRQAYDHQPMKFCSLIGLQTDQLLFYSRSLNGNLTLASYSNP